VFEPAPSHLQLWPLAAADLREKPRVREKRPIPVNRREYIQVAGPGHSANAVNRT
jgi:hypothetical protein